MFIAVRTLATGVREWSAEK